MPRFRYRAITADGAVTEGYVEAATRTAVIDQIQSAGQIPLLADEVQAARSHELSQTWAFWRRDRVTQSDIGFFTRELATLLQAGLPLDHALNTLQGLAARPAVQDLIQSLHKRVQGGAQLSAALEEHGDLFSQLYLNTVRAGEAGGALETVLQRLADYLESSAELRSTVISALIYPAILVVIAAASVFALLIFVVPQFEPIFADMGDTLPLPTRIVFGSADLLRSYGFLLIPAAAAAVWLWRSWLVRQDNRRRWDGWLLRLPLVGSLIQKLEIGRFARTLATLLSNGVPLLAAIGIVREVLSNQALANDMIAVESALEHGRGLAQPLREQSHFPPLAAQLIQVGEESGELETMLVSVANIYDRDTNIAIKRSLAIIEPVLILGLGAVIALIILSILVAILGLNELVV